jgi:hypothetical protein
MTANDVSPDLLASMTPAERRRWLRRYAGERNRREFLLHLEQCLRGFPWTWWGVLTLRSTLSSGAVLRAFDRWRHRTNRRIWGPRYKRDPAKGLRCFACVEQQAREVPHVHFLARNTAGANPNIGTREWSAEHREPEGHTRVLRIASISPFEPSRGGIAYCVKTIVASDQRISWDFFSHKSATS